MLRRLLLPLFLLVPFATSAPPMASAENAAVFASPNIGHSGDTMWLSGTGLIPNTQYAIFMACPVWTDHNAYRYGNIVYIGDGPVTDVSGSFIQFEMKVVTLRHLHESGCFVYVQQGTQLGFAGQSLPLPAQYHIYPKNTRLKYCFTHICGDAALSPRPARSGRYETIDLTSNGFGGAYVDVTVSFGSAKPYHVYTVLGWNGTGRMRIKLPRLAAKITKARVSASFSLGKFKGAAKPAHFTIVR